MKRYHIHIEGRVQGVGFRPFVYNLARDNAMTGTVANTLKGVHIFVNADRKKLDKFIRFLYEKSPSQALITSIACEEIAFRPYHKFSIIESHLLGNPDLLITPDFAICDRCKRELRDPRNRRHNYPFITCTYCGPRYSIESALPYDRKRTSMASFHICDACRKEYEEPKERRFYSQTNSCPDCRISQWVVDKEGKMMTLEEGEIIDFVCGKISDGGIIAAKGIGGFLLICDPYNYDTVNKLRTIKHRPAKPFALMYPGVDQIRKDFRVSKSEWKELKGPEAPIVLFQIKNRSRNAAKLLSAIAPGLDRLGVMVPYAPWLLLLAEKINQPLLATSGNQKASPIIYKNEEAVASLCEFADYLVLNNRDINIPQDDSVLKFSDTFKQKIVIRRSRGYAPAFDQQAVNQTFTERILAMGALLKSTFCVWQEGRCHISQFLGDSTEFDAQVSYERTLHHITHLLKFKPEVIVVDKHPAYFTTQLGKEICVLHDASFIEMLHHEAHFWAVLGENNLLNAGQDILGVVFDGTGMGNDGAIWGGEFYRLTQGKLTRIHHIEYYAHILGDKMAREPRLSAFAVLHSIGENHDLINEHFLTDEIDYYSRVLENSTLMTSSMGRMFDAVSSLLGLCQINTYEGEAAMYLERAARQYCNRIRGFPKNYPVSFTDQSSVAYEKMIRAIIGDIQAGKDRGEIAARFHSTVVYIVECVAEKTRCGALAFSGGVFQNGLLVDMIIDQLGNKYALHFHKELSPTDECISYGQLVGYYATKMQRKKMKKIGNKKSTVS